MQTRRRDLNIVRRAGGQRSLGVAVAIDWQDVGADARPCFVDAEETAQQLIHHIRLRLVENSCLSQAGQERDALDGGGRDQDEPAIAPASRAKTDRGGGGGGGGRRRGKLRAT